MSKPTKEQLQETISILETKLSMKDEELIEAGVKKRETMMSKIEDVEQGCRDMIKHLIKNCEKETGRELTGTDDDPDTFNDFMSK
jgi:hypothetical protein